MRVILARGAPAPRQPSYRPNSSSSERQDGTKWEASEGGGGVPENRAGLSDDAPLTTMVVEVHREPEFEEPLGRELGHARVLRTSVLVSVPDEC